MSRESGIPDVAALFAAGLLAALAGCGGHPPAQRPPTPLPPARAVRVALVQAGDTGAVRAPASVQARQRASLSARLAVAVLELPFREGDFVAAGAVLARLDDRALRSALAAAEAAAAAAEADLARAETLLTKRAATPREAEDARTRAAAARAGVQAAHEALAYAVLRAPFSGVVASRPVHVGDVVSPGATVIELEGAGGLELVATLNAVESRLVRVGQKLTASVDGQAGGIEATVRSLSPAGDPATHRFEMRADLPPAAGLRSGLFARLELPAVGGDARLVVPQDAVFQRGGLTGLFVLQDGRARLRWVATGASDDGSIEIRAGVAQGERVILEPAELIDGAPVVESR